MLRFLVWLIHWLPLLDYEHPIPFTQVMEGLEYSMIKRKAEIRLFWDTNTCRSDLWLHHCSLPMLQMKSCIYALGHTAAVAMLWLISKDLGSHISTRANATYRQFFKKKTPSESQSARFLTEKVCLELTKLSFRRTKVYIEKLASRSYQIWTSDVSKSKQRSIIRLICTKICNINNHWY